MTEPSAAGRRCDFCQSPVPGEPVTATVDGAAYDFCTRACRDAMAERDRVFTPLRGARRFDPGVAALSAKLPQGLPRSSAVLVGSRPGTREGALLAELVWRTLQRGEPAVFVSFTEPPAAVVERFLELGWNVLPALEEGRLHLLDCFTYRVDDRDRMLARMNEWTSHLWRVAEAETTAVRDPSNVGEVQNRLDDCLEAKSLADRGLVVVDSLTEFGSLVQPVRAYDFVKDLRADVCKGRFVPVVAGATYAGDGDRFPHDLEYLFDGLVDLDLDGETVEGALIKRIRVRKMSGVLAYAEWSAYEFTGGEGLVTFDPLEEIEKSRAAREAASAGDGTPEEREGPEPAPEEHDGDDA